MGFITPNAGVSGPAAAGNARTARALRSAAGKAVRAKDEVVAGADSVELERAVRDLKANDQEDAREDHQQGGGCTSAGTAAKGAQVPRLDVAG